MKTLIRVVVLCFIFNFSYRAISIETTVIAIGITIIICILDISERLIDIEKRLGGK